MSESLPGKSHGPECQSCFGTGEFPSDMGMVDCPDCGGSGTLPSRSTLTDWRARDIGRRYDESAAEPASDIQWLLAELQRARSALHQIVALAMDVADDDPIARQVRAKAYDALGLYEAQSVRPPPNQAHPSE